MPFLLASKWLAQTVATLSPGPKITIPYNSLLFKKIRYKSPYIIDLINRAESYQNVLREDNRVNSQAALARKLGLSKARLTQIMNLLKLAPEIRSYIKKLDDLELLNYFNEKRLRPIAGIEDKQTQLEKFEELKLKIRFCGYP